MAAVEDTVRTLRGTEAVVQYGVCSCARATIQNQRWSLVRVVKIDADGSHLGTVYVVCDLCGDRLGAR
jgi:hypothetical protein